MNKLQKNQQGFGVMEALLIVVLLAIIASVGVYFTHVRSNSIVTSNTEPTNSSSSTPPNTPQPNTPQLHTTQEAVAFVQKTYDDYLVALNQANNNKSNTQPVAQVGLAAVKSNLSSDLYAKAAAVTQATPFSCTAQYVTDKYTASLSSSDKTNAVVAVSISNGSGLSTQGMTATVDLASLIITSVTCPS